MDNKEFYFASSTVELSETKTYLELKNRLCYYDEPNLNNLVLPSDNAEKLAQTLVNQPVVAKYKPKGNLPDLGGHECYRGTDGKLHFDTMPVGTHVSVEVKPDTVVVNGETKTLPCLFATSHIWTRYENFCAAVKRLFAEGNLRSSWEIMVFNSEDKDGVKIAKDYVFESNALLGSSTQPAYGEAASALELAEQQPEYVLAQALTMDLENGRKVEPKMDNAITSEELTAQVVKLSTDMALKDKELAEVKEKAEKLEVDISERDKALAAANEKVTELTATISELAKYKEIVEKQEAERAAAEKQEKREQLKAYALKSKLITAEEVETSEEIKKLIDDVDDAGIARVISERFMKTLSEEEKPAEKPAKEVASVKVTLTEEEPIDVHEFMRTFLSL